MLPPPRHIRSSAFLLSLLATLAAGCALAPEGTVDDEAVTSAAAGLTPTEKLALATRFAPVFFQDTDSSNYKADYITKFNFDRDYNGKNNWDSLDRYTTLPAHVYWSMSETSTHYFLGYYVFHPRDWRDYSWSDEHENDLEGVMVAVKKTSSGGRVVAMQTQAHGDFFAYTRPGSGTTEAISAVEHSSTLTLEGLTHPRLFIEAKKHGIYACGANCSSTANNDGIVYVVADAPASPTGGSGTWTQRVGYGLIAMDATTGDRGFWAQRDDICDTCTFGEWGLIRGEKYGTNNATAPWVWDDPNDGPTLKGDFIRDSARLFDATLNGPEFDSGFSRTYVDNIYRFSNAPTRPSGSSTDPPVHRQ